MTTFKSSFSNLNYRASYSIQCQSVRKKTGEKLKNMLKKFNILQYITQSLCNDKRQTYIDKKYIHVSVNLSFLWNQVNEKYPSITFGKS